MSVLSVHKLVGERTKNNKTKQTHAALRANHLFCCRINLHGALNSVNYMQGHKHTHAHISIDDRNHHHKVKSFHFLCILKSISIFIY